MYTCKDCLETKDKGEFPINAHLYRNPRCRLCHNAYKRSLRLRDPEVTKQSDTKRRQKENYKEIHTKAQKSWELKNPGHKTAYMRELRAKSPEFREKQRLVSNTYNAKHREERLAYQKARQDERKAFIDSFKDKPCKDCNKKFPTYCMDFDHVRGEKKDNISGMKNNRTLKRIQEEIEKCDLVCAICHRIRTQSRITTNQLPAVKD